MAFSQEPNIAKGYDAESSFQRAIKEEIEKMLDQKRIEGTLIEYFILENFGLDIAVFIHWQDNRYSIRCFELKAFLGLRPDGVGFGNRQGVGLQVDLLILGVQKLNLADQFIRWILVDGTKLKGTDRFVIFDNIQAKNAAMGGVVARGKTNNFRVNQLIKKAISWNELSKEIESFL